MKLQVAEASDSNAADPLPSVFSKLGGWRITMCVVHYQLIDLAINSIVILLYNSITCLHIATFIITLDRFNIKNVVLNI